MQQTKRIKTMCAVHKGIFEVGDNDKVYIDLGNKTVTVCIPCQNKIKNLEVCEICKNPRPKNQVKTIRLVDSKKFRRICIWCILDFDEEEEATEFLREGEKNKMRKGLGNTEYTPIEGIPIARPPK